MKKNSFLKTLCLMIPVLSIISGCGSEGWFGSGDKTLNIEGKRISVITYEDRKQSEDKPSSSVKIPAAESPKDWRQSGQNTEHHIGNLAFSKDAQPAWQANIGSGSSYSNRLIAEPIVADGIIYTLDSMGTLSAFRLDDGGKLWDKEIAKDADDATVIGAGISYAEGKIFATTGLGQVMAVDAKTSEILWQKDLLSPIRSAPTPAMDNIYVMSADSRIYAFKQSDGSEIWRYSSVTESTTILGAASPTVSGNVLISVFSSGDIIALDARNGRQMWSDGLATSLKLEGLSAVLDIVARPVVEKDILYILGYSSVIAAFDVNTGERKWTRQMGGASNHLVAGNAIFLITNEGDMVALDKASGKNIWVRPLPKYTNEEDRTGRITWTGPLMLDGRILIVGSYGEMAFLDPLNSGKLISRQKVAESIQIPPVYADRNLILLSSDAQLMVYR